MELGLSEEQRLLQDTVRQLCESRFPLTALRRTEADPAGLDRAFWAQLCDIGVPAMPIAPEQGGLGFGMLETALVFEQLGRQLAITPLFTSSLVAAALFAASGDALPRDQWLAEIAQGAIVAVAMTEPGGSPDIARCTSRFDRTSDGIRLSGVKHFVPFASIASALLVIARDSAGGAPAALLVPRDTPGVTIRHQANLATEPYFEITFTGAMLPAENLLAIDDLPGIWREISARGHIALAAQAVGAARHAHEISLAYAKTREAFGQPIGGFQAIAHYLADAIVEIEGCQMLFHQAAWFHDQGLAFEAAAAIAKLQAGAMFRRVSALAIQIHGGIGYTSEADPQLFFRRAKQWQLLDGGDAYLEDEIARLTIDPAMPGARAAG
ncbi:acyl-CoA dehydrogenase family protein [Sphingomonas colocasiae]|uniref:Acyl-CoA/acyl-ACP dehydrogenase n=1 Tax=Sphingomonas colocasiae TaxID=1848973 RepID=A0ABS7PQG9_9SPHN|nr:acyl-CoA dehydrogenase family protein [Sphingomonas colocasiae]MBY8823580.1 acyl-CoA/acyl-ACP dehydrogenase [Sphingomonas colocasiae]